jgi:hypothetical protein
MTVLTVPDIYDTLREGLVIGRGKLKEFKEKLKAYLRKNPDPSFAMLWTLEAARTSGRWDVHFHPVFRSSRELADEILPMWSNLFDTYVHELDVEECRSPAKCVRYALKSDLISGRVPEEFLVEYVRETKSDKRERFRGVLGKLVGLDKKYREARKLEREKTNARRARVTSKKSKPSKVEDTNFHAREWLGYFKLALSAGVTALSFSTSFSQLATRRSSGKIPRIRRSRAVRRSRRGLRRPRARTLSRAPPRARHGVASGLQLRHLGVCRRYERPRYWCNSQ